MCLLFDLVMQVREAEQIQNTLPHRTVNAIKFRWNDKLKKKFVESNSSVDLQVSFFVLTRHFFPLKSADHAPDDNRFLSDSSRSVLLFLFHCIS